jgi:hypothetical protein
MRIRCLTLALLAGAANAGTTTNLPLPTIRSLNSAIPSTCTWVNYATPFTIATGFSADGNYVNGTADNQAICGHSGRGSNLTYWPYCATFTWDLSGNLVNTVIGQCYKANVATYTNAGGYEASTFVQTYFGYLQYEYPVLTTP